MYKDSCQCIVRAYRNYLGRPYKPVNVRSILINYLNLNKLSETVTYSSMVFYLYNIPLLCRIFLVQTTRLMRTLQLHDSEQKLSLLST